MTDIDSKESSEWKEPTVESLRKQVAELEIKAELPMKYKRMQHNAELQRQLAACEKERDEYLTECRTLTRQNGEWKEMVAACQQYLKDGETPAERMARYHHDIQGLLGQLGATLKERDEWKSWSRLNKNDPLREKLAASQAREQKMRECLERYCSDKCNAEYNPCEARKALSHHDLNTCPQCGGEADNGHDRCYPPTAYLCSKCQQLPSNPR